METPTIETYRKKGRETFGLRITGLQDYCYGHLELTTQYWFMYTDPSN
jgi:hypothetical protein